MLKPVVLKNGLTVLRLPKAGSGAFTVGFVASTGSVIEEGYFPQGISLLVERLFWRGTDKHPSVRSLNLALENVGGDFYSQTSRELTQFYLTVPSYHQYKAISMLAEVIQHSYFQSVDVEAEKRALVEDIKRVEDDILTLDGSELSLANLYQNHSLGLPVEGSVDSVLSITQEDIAEYLAHQYRPDKSFLVLAGNFDTKQTMELVDQEWTFWNPRSKKFIEPMDFHPEDVGELPRITYRQRGLSQTRLSMGFLLDGGLQPSLPGEDESDQSQVNPKEVLDTMLTDWAKLLVLSAVLGEGLSSRLWTKGVEEELFFANVASKIMLFRSTGYIHIGGLTDNSQFTFALESVLSVLEALKKTTVSINELAKAKEYIKGRLVLQHEDLLVSTIWQVEHLVGSGLTFEVADLIQKVEKVEAAQLRSLALDLFVPQRLAMTTLGTAKETRLVDKLLKKYLG